MTNVMSLPISERVRFDQRRISEMFRTLEEPVATNMIRNAVAGIVTALADGDDALTRRDFAFALANLDVLVSLGWQLGLPSLATVAQNLRDGIRQRDDIAIAAVHARLQRVVTLSLERIRQTTVTV